MGWDPGLRTHLKLVARKHKETTSSELGVFLQDGLAACKKEHSSHRLNLTGVEVYPRECDKAKAHRWPAVCDLREGK